MAGQQPAHDRGNRPLARLQQKVEVVGDQGPGKTARSGFCQYLSQPIQKIIPVGVVLEYLPALDTPDDNMMKRSGCIYSCLPWHACSLS
jgi:hypothetical protein